MATGRSQSRLPLQAGIESCQNDSARSCGLATSCGTGTNFGKSRQKGEGEGFSGEMGTKWAAGRGRGVPRRRGGRGVGVVVSAWGTAVKGKRPASGVLEGVFAGESPRRSGGGGGGGNRTPVPKQLTKSFYVRSRPFGSRLGGLRSTGCHVGQLERCASPPLRRAVSSS